MLGESWLSQEASSTAAVGFLSVRPDGTWWADQTITMTRATINNVPFFRLQAGGNAVILNQESVILD